MPVFQGTSSNEVLEGTTANDTIIGGAGNDTLIGVSGSDVFQFADNSGHDFIIGFDVSNDRLLIPGARDGLVGSIEDISEVNGNVVISFGEDSSVELNNVSLEAFRVEALIADTGLGVLTEGEVGDASGVVNVFIRNLSAVPLSNGGFALVWEQSIDNVNSVYNVRTRIYDENGARAGGAFRLNFFAGDNSRHAAEPLEGGGYVVAWTNFAQKKSFFSIIDNEGNVLASNVEFSDDFEMTLGVVAMKDGGFLVLFDDISSLKALRYDASGTQVGGETILHNNQRLNVDLRGGYGGIQLEDGSIVIHWGGLPDGGLSNGVSNQGVGLRLFNSDLEPVTDSFLVNQVQEGTQTIPDIIELEDGGFVVVWQTLGLVQSEYFQSYRVFNADGTPRTDEILIEGVGSSEGFLTDINVTATDDGGFAIGWRSVDDNIYVQQFNADGTPSTNRIALDELTDPWIGRLDIATLADGTGVVIRQNDARRPEVQLIDFANRSAVGNDSDLVRGTAADDFLSGLGGADSLVGAEGADLLFGGDGADNLAGETGSDTLHGGAGSDILNGGIGNDMLLGGKDGDTIDGGAGVDTAAYLGSASAITANLATGNGLRGDAAGDQYVSVENLIGSGFSDRLIGNAVANSLVGDDGADTLIGGNGNDTAEGGDGDDTFFAGSGDVGDDLFVGGSGDDLVAAGDGADLLVGDGAEAAGLQGNSGTAGSDTLFGGNGDDTLLGDSWTDSNGNGSFDVGEQSISGSATNIAYGGAGNDVVYGADGADTLGGGAGNDTLTGGSGRDILYGGQGALDNDDVFRGDAGADTVFGSAGADVINGQTGEDQLFGGSGEDTIDGGDGTDSLFGGGGDDELTGGSDGDVFFFAGDHGADVITDFDVSEDTLFLENTVTDFTDLASVQAAASETTQNGQSGLLIDTGDGNSIFLVNVGVNEISQTNLSF